MKKPGKSDPSRPREDGYDYKRDFYRSSQVAEDYDFHRFSSPERQKRNARKWAAIRKALAADHRGAHHPRSALRHRPIHRGAGPRGLRDRRQRHLARDAAEGGIPRTRKRPTASSRSSAATCRPTRKPCRCAVTSLDCVVCIRFMMHVDPATRVRMLREFHRVSRRWVVVDYRHKYTFRYVLTHTLGKLGIGRTPLSRVSRTGSRAGIPRRGIRRSAR